MSGRACPSCGGVLAFDQELCPACGAPYVPSRSGARGPLLAAAAVLAAAIAAAVLAYGALRDDAEREAARTVPLTESPTAPAGARELRQPDPATP